MRGTPWMFASFQGGLNTNASVYDIEPPDCRDCLNVVSTPRGAIKKRNGCTIFATGPGDEINSFLGVAPDGGARKVIAAAGTALYSFNASGGGLSTIASGFTDGARWEFAQAPASTLVGGQGPVYGMNGVDPPQQWDTFSAANAWTGQNGGDYYGSAPYVPNGAWCVYTGNRMFVAGVSSTPDTLYYSDFLDPSSWPVNNFLNFDKGDGQPITGIGVAGPYLLVFKERKCWAVNIAAIDTGGVVVRKLDDNIGCIAHRSVVATEAGTFFLSDRGVFMTDGLRLHEMSYNVRPTFEGINPAFRSLAAAGFFRDHYYISFPDGTAVNNSVTLDYDVVAKAWWRHSVPANQWQTWEPSAGFDLLFAVAGVETPGLIGNAFVANATTDTFLPSPFLFTSYWRGPWHVFGTYVNRRLLATPFLKKRIRQLHFDGSGVITVAAWKNFQQSGQQSPGTVGNAPQYRPVTPIDFSSGTQIYGNPDTTQLYGGENYNGRQMLFGGTSAVSEARLYALGVANAVSVEFGNQLAQPFEVDSYMMSIDYRKS